MSLSSTLKDITCSLSSRETFFPSVKIINSLPPSFPAFFYVKLSPTTSQSELSAAFISLVRYSESFLPFSDDALSKAYKLLEFLLTQPLNPESTEIWPDSHITPQQWFDGLLAIAHTNSGYLLTIILRLIARISSDLNHESRVVVLTSGFYERFFSLSQSYPSPIRHTQFHSLLLTSVNDLLSLALTPEMEQDDNIPAGQTSHHSNIVNHLILPMQPYFRYFSRHHLMFPDLSTNTIFLVAVSKIAEIFVADVNLLSITSLTLHFSTYLSILEACKRELEWYLRLFDFRQFRARWMKCSKQTDNWNEFMRSLNEYGLSDVLDRQGFMDESGRCGGRVRIETIHILNLSGANIAKLE